MSGRRISISAVCSMAVGITAGAWGAMPACATRQREQLEWDVPAASCPWVMRTVVENAISSAHSTPMRRPRWASRDRDGDNDRNIRNLMRKVAQLVRRSLSTHRKRNPDLKLKTQHNTPRRWASSLVNPGRKRNPIATSGSPAGRRSGRQGLRRRANPRRGRTVRRSRFWSHRPGLRCDPGWWSRC